MRTSTAWRQLRMSEVPEVGARDVPSMVPP